MEVIEFLEEMPKQPDYLSFVDEDIKEMFEGKGGYLSTDILLAQLIKELRLNRKKEF